MADADSVIPPSKKRAAGREISKDNPGLDDDDDNASEQELGTFKKASDEVLATRRIVKVRRQTPVSAPSSNPFAGIQLVPPKVASDTPAAPVAEVLKETEVAKNEGGDVAVDGDKEGGDDTQNNGTKEKSDLGNNQEEAPVENKVNVASPEKQISEVKDSSSAVDECKSEVAVNKIEGGEANKVEESAEQGLIQDAKDENEVGAGDSNLNPFQQLSGGKNAFTGFTATGFSSSSFSLKPVLNDETSASINSVSTGQKTDQPLFGFGFPSNNQSGSLFGTKDSSVSKIEPLQEVPTETGEENETAVFTANSALFEYHDGSWKERGRGEVKVNVSAVEGSKARLVMRTKGNYRLILNASLYPEMKLTYMDKKGITFAAINSSGQDKGSLSTYALKFKDGSVADEFHAVVTSHKGTPAAVLKTPENAPQ